MYEVNQKRKSAKPNSQPELKFCKSPVLSFPPNILLCSTKLTRKFKTHVSRFMCRYIISKTSRCPQIDPFSPQILALILTPHRCPIPTSLYSPANKILFLVRFIIFQISLHIARKPKNTYHEWRTFIR